MNKLVSRNPVQRFKQGRKIVKASGGLDTGTLNGRNVTKKDGIWVYDDTNSPIAGMDYKKIITTKTPGKKQDYSFMKGGTRQRTPDEVQKLKDPKIQKYLQRQQSQGFTAKPIKKTTNSNNRASNRVSTSRRPLKTQEQWNNEFANNFTNTLTQAQRQYLDSKGVNYTSASDVQKFLMNQLHTDLGGYKDDGKWGKNSIQAWKDFAANNIRENFDVTQEQKNMNVGTIPYVSKPVANFGYRTSNTYEDNDFSDRLKNMGIRSNADLINFMNRTSGENYNWNGDNWARQFRSDVNQALGGNYSDANIRKVFNTSNNWGRGFLGRGDIGDFQTALQTNAGLWNGSYDRNLENYVKNIDWSKFKLFKQGGQLISKDPIKRFKQKNVPVTTLKTGGSIPKYQGGNYIVKKGDNLSTIARTYGKSLQELLKMNSNIKHPNKIQVGQRIRISNTSSPVPEYLLRKENKINLPTIASTAPEKFVPTKSKVRTSSTKRRKYAYGKTAKEQPQQQQQASNFSFDKLKSLGKEIYGRVFGDKDIITGRTKQEEDKYQYIYNTPYSLELDRGEPMMELVTHPDGFQEYRHVEGVNGRPVYESKVGKLGLFNRQIDEDGRVCYQIKNDKGQIVTRCSETGNLINRTLKLPTTGDAWKRQGVYGDSLIYGQPDHNKFYTRPVGKVINGLRPSQLNPSNLKTGDFVDLYTEGSGHNAEAATGRGNSHTGTIYKPEGDRGPVYIIHGGLGDKVYVDPLNRFGPMSTWSIMSVRRPGSKEHPYYED